MQNGQNILLLDIVSTAFIGSDFGRIELGFVYFHSDEPQQIF